MIHLPKRIFDLYYGQPASGKSRAAAHVIRAVHEQTGKKGRVLVGDGSTSTYDELVDAGVVELCEFAHRPWPFDTTKRLMEGWFPADPADPFAPLVEPSKQPTFNDIGIYVIEGVSMLGEYIMGSVKGGLAEQSGRGVQIGQDTPYRIEQGEKDGTGKFTSGPGTTFGGNPVAHYNVGQRNITSFVQISKGLATYVIWTGHETVNDPEKDQLTKEMIAGPEVVGKKLTDKFQRLYNNTIHFQSVAKRTKTKDVHLARDMNDLDIDYRLWTRDHFSPDQNTMIRYKAVTRGVEGLDHYYDSIEAYYNAVAEKKGLTQGGVQA